jgi:signal transduction histidine kinase
MQDQAKTKKQLIHELTELRRRNAELESSERKRKIAERKLQEEEAKQFSRRLISLMEKERKRIARDLHDVFGQTLTGLHLMAESLRDCLPDDLQKHKAKCDELIAMIEEAVDFVRHISYRMRPDMLDDLGLVPTMQSYIRGFAVRKPELRINIKNDNFTDNIDTETKLVLYRIFQEALHNIAKHAHARTANVSLEYTHPKVVLTIEDDGVGFPVQIEDLLQLSGINEKGIGLISIRERAASVGGNVSIRSKKDKGTTLKVEVDISRRQKDAQNQSVSG